ncbi:hypothetical protein [Paraburkholderia sp. CNPSo 3281]|uniref:hypothetical protein n=1 Tax=Paraburkholderia sp. CNPSo 3281 TaxID=2940933 RepID=UPI0020B88D62|nr:hypothetical protein [Paraburkholderia sp. CNPSo 3281]MCP3718509.1 hypothetical protein [Paraburkholderia sp. CNPSo 3281]
MNDLAWMVRDSTSAWLRGYGDLRFDQYESFYRKALTVHGAPSDLEQINEEYTRWIEGRPSRMLSLLNRPVVAHALIAFTAVWIGGQAVPHLAGIAPKSTGALLVAAFIGLRVFHRKRRKRGN